MESLKLDEQHSWHALYTKSRAEKKVLEQLTKMDIKAYLPMKKVLKQWSDRKKWIEQPVISSYIFVYISKAQYKSVFDAPGVVAYVCNKGTAVTIPEHQMDTMRKAIENQLVFTIQDGELSKGQSIEVTSGPLKGVKGTVNEIKGNKKLYLSLTDIGYTMVIDLNKATVKKV